MKAANGKTQRAGACGTMVEDMAPCAAGPLSAGHLAVSELKGASRWIPHRTAATSRNPHLVTANY
ncbi:hypothetical protein EON66_06715 [archaeon]|nr:MAG: hypothetical protein EON66_06715 [archaeon]